MRLIMDRTRLKVRAPRPVVILVLIITCFKQVRWYPNIKHSSLPWVLPLPSGPYNQASLSKTPPFCTALRGLHV